MHGHTKIQLFDAKTGKLTDEVEKDNTFTGALEEYIASCLFYGNLTNNLMLRTESKDQLLNYLGGVLVFSDNIDESHMFPTAEDRFKYIGHAGLKNAKEYANDPTAGILNTLETEYNFIDGNYKLVWDFGTEACVDKDIGAICLTYPETGYHGLKTHVDSSLINNIDKSVVRSINNLYLHSPIDLDGRELFKSGSSNTAYKGNAFKDYSNGIKFDITSRNHTERSELESFTTPSYYIRAFSKNNYFHITGSYNSSTKKYTLTKYDILGNVEGTPDEIDFTDVLLDSNFKSSDFNRISSNLFRFWEDKNQCFLFPNNNYFWRVNKNGTYSKKQITSEAYFKALKKIDLSNFGLGYFRDCIILRGDGPEGSWSYNGANLLINISDLSLGNYEENICYLDNINFCWSFLTSSPFIGMSTSDNKMQLLRDYLATINNQSPILHKAPGKTMKIIYTISEV